MPLHKSAVSCFVDCQRLVSFSERERHEPVCSIANRFSHLDLLSLSSMSSIQRKDFNKFHQCSPVSWFCQRVLWISWNHMICNIVSTLVISGDFTCKAVMEMRNWVKCDHIIKNLLLLSCSFLSFYPFVSFHSLFFLFIAHILFFISPFLLYFLSAHFSLSPHSLSLLIFCLYSYVCAAHSSFHLFHQREAAKNGKFQDLVLDKGVGLGVLNFPKCVFFALKTYEKRQKS